MSSMNPSESSKKRKEKEIDPYSVCEYVHYDSDFSMCCCFVLPHPVVSDVPYVWAVSC